MKRHARCEEDRVQLDRWHPDIVRLNAVAHAMILLENRRYRDALEFSRETIGPIDDLVEGTVDQANLPQVLREAVCDALANRPSL